MNGEETLVRTLSVKKTMRKSSLRHVKREGRRRKVTSQQKGTVKALDQKPWGVTIKRLHNWLKATWMRWTYCRKRMNAALKTDQMWTTVRNSMNLASRKILENAVKVWVDNLKTERKVRWAEGLFKDERLITGNVKTESLWDKVKETLRSTGQILRKVNHWSRKRVKSD